MSGVNGTFNGTDTPLDPFNRKAEYSRSDLDLRNRFVGSLVYSPTFTIADRPLRLLANGWTAAGTLTEQTGFPVTPFVNNSPSSPVGDGGVTGGELSLNNAGTPGRAPQLPRNTFPGPGLRNLDFRMGRNIPIHEGMYLQFFAEAFNLLNHQNRLSVNTTAFSYTNANSGVCSRHANGCISPYYVPATATTNASGTPFEATTSTTSILYGVRQLQFSAKLFFLKLIVKTKAPQIAGLFIALRCFQGVILGGGVGRNRPIEFLPS